MNWNITITILMASSLLISSCNGAGGDDNLPKIKKSVYKNQLGSLCWPTQLTKEKGNLIITDYRNNRFLVQENGTWKQSNISVNGAHSLAVDKQGNFIIDDTENNRIIIATSLDDASVIKHITSINGRPLDRPHEVAILESGDIYIIDSLRLIRLSHNYKKTDEFWFKPDDLGYTRSLKIIDGDLYVINSSSGDLIKITNFDKGDYEIIKTSSHKINDSAGSYERTGPIINEVEKFNGWFYASNYFTSSWAKGTDPEKNKLIRWKSW